MTPWLVAADVATAAGRAVLPLLSAVVVFMVVYRSGHLILRGWQRRHYRRMLILYQASGPTVRMGWWWHVTLAPAVGAIIRGYAALRLWLIAVPPWANRRLVGSGMGVSRRDLRGIRLGGVVLAAILGVTSRGNLVAIVGGGLLGMLLPIFLARHRIGRRRQLIAEQLPHVLTVMITALRAGRSMAQTIDVIADEADQPARAEFVLVAQKHRLGVDLSDALKQLADRIDNADLHLLVNSLIVQRETGGNLVPMLETIDRTVRERLRFQGEIRTVTSQVRLAARVITALPFALFGMMVMINPRGVSFFWTSWPLGPGLIGVALVLILLGHLIMGRLLVLG